MKKISISLFLVIGGIGFYLYSINKQISDVDAVCSLFPEGEMMTNLKEVDEKYSLSLRGPFKLNDRPGVFQALFCADLTMCNASCTILFQDGTVVKSQAVVH